VQRVCFTTVSSFKLPLSFFFFFLPAPLFLYSGFLGNGFPPLFCSFSFRCTFIEHPVSDPQPLVPLSFSLLLCFSNAGLVSFILLWTSSIRRKGGLKGYRPPHLSAIFFLSARNSSRFIFCPPFFLESRFWCDLPFSPSQPRSHNSSEQSDRYFGHPLRFPSLFREDDTRSVPLPPQQTLPSCVPFCRGSNCFPCFLFSLKTLVYPAFVFRFFFLLGIPPALELQFS